MLNKFYLTKTKSDKDGRIQEFGVDYSEINYDSTNESIDQQESEIISKTEDTKAKTDITIKVSGSYYKCQLLKTNEFEKDKHDKKKSGSDYAIGGKDQLLRKLKKIGVKDPMLRKLKKRWL